MSLTSKMRDRQSPFGYEDDKLWLLTQDELQATARLGVPVETIMGKHTLYLGDASKEDTRTIKFYNDGEEIEITAYGVRESIISGLSSQNNAGMVLRAAFEFVSEVAERIESKRNWDLLPEGRSSVVIDLEGCQDIARSADSGIAQAIIVLQSTAPFIVESMRQALVDHHEHGTPVSDQMLKLAADILRVRHNTEDAR